MNFQKFVFFPNIFLPGSGSPGLAPQVGPYRVTKVYSTKNVLGFKQMDKLVKWTAAPLIMFVWVITFRFYLGFGGRGSRIGIDQFVTRFQD